MFDFNSAFKDSLQIATERFKKADADLREIVKAVADSLNAASGEALRLTLVDDETDRGMVYRIVVAHRGEEDLGLPDHFRDTIVAFRVTVKGYPIEQGGHDGERFHSIAPIESRSALEAYFAGLASSSESPLVLKAATLLALNGKRSSCCDEDLDYCDPVFTVDDEDDLEECVPF